MGFLDKLFGKENAVTKSNESDHLFDQSRATDERLREALLDEFGTTAVSEFARKILSECIIHENIEAMKSLATIEGRGARYNDSDDIACIPKSHLKALRWWKEVAKRTNDAAALFKCGDILLYGTDESDRASKAEGMSFLRRAADAGHRRAQYKYGLILELGDYTEKNEALAFSYYKKAALQGEADAMHCLSLCYACGSGVEEDSYQALYWNKSYVDVGSEAIDFPPEQENIDLALSFVESKPLRKVTIQRARHTGGSSIDYLIYVDGTLYAQAPNGATVSFEIPDGFHQIYAESNLLGKYAASFGSDRSNILMIEDDGRDININMDFKRGNLIIKIA